MQETPLQWLYGGTIEPGEAQCYLCGASCTEQHDVRRAIADTFNSHYLAKVPTSSRLCAACAWYLDNKAGHPEFRKMSLVVFRHAWLDWPRAAMKGDIVRWLDQGMPSDAFLVVSLTKKKHVLLQALMTAQGSMQLAVQVEEQVAHFDKAAWKAIDGPFMALLAMGHGKGEILPGQLYANTLRKHGRITEALAHSQQLDAWRSSPALTLLSYVTMLDKENDATNAD